MLLYDPRVCYTKQIFGMVLRVFLGSTTDDSFCHTNIHRIISCPARVEKQERSRLLLNRVDRPVRDGAPLQDTARPPVRPRRQPLPRSHV